MADEAEAGGERVVMSGRSWWHDVVRRRVAAVSLALAAAVAWWVHDHWRRGEAELVNIGPPLTVEVLDESGTIPVGEPIELITRTTLRLPDGDYWVRLSGRGRLGQTYRLAVNRGESIQYRMSLDGGRLLGDDPDEPFQRRSPADPVPFRASTTAVEFLPGKADIIHTGRATILRRDGADGTVVWDASRPMPAGLRRPSDRPGSTGSLVDPGPWVRAIADHPEEVAAIVPAPDLNGDGTRDLVWTYHNAPGLLAMSGADGAVLWNFHAEPDGKGGPRPAGPAAWRSDMFVSSDSEDTQTHRGQILGEPALFDVDRDGTLDVIATVTFGKPKNAPGRGIGDAASLEVSSRRIFAVSGKTGRRLWQAPAGNADRDGQVDRRAVLVRGRSASTVAFVLGSRWIGLDPATGGFRGEPIDLGSEPVRPVQYGDLDGDGEPELLALMPAVGGSGQALSAYSLTGRKPLWTAPMTISLEAENLDPAADWTWLVRLDSAGTTAVIVPDDGPMPPGPGYRGVRRLDGRTGRALWTRPMRPNPGRYDDRTQCVDAPDLDGDGIREVILAWCDGQPDYASSDSYPEPLLWLYVDALSGKDGHPLWSWHESPSTAAYVGVHGPVWYGRGPDGLPLLAVPADRYDPDAGGDNPFGLSTVPIVHVLEASTGRERHVVPGLGDPRAADLDGDGVLDLWGEVGDEVAAFPGTLPEVWRALGSGSIMFGVSRSQAGGDLDGDGVADVLPVEIVPGDGLHLDPTSDPTVVARSGADGHVLWKSRLGSPWSWFGVGQYFFDRLTALPAPAGDLDGDGTGDLVITSLNSTAAGPSAAAPHLPVRALSGRTGRFLWSAGPMPAGSTGTDGPYIDVSRPPLAVAIEPGGRPDILVRSFSQRAASSSGPPAAAMREERLTRLSGRDGRVVWDISLIRGATGPQYAPVGDAAAPPMADVDGDGSPEILVLGSSVDDRGTMLNGLRAFSLATGRALWIHPIDANPFSVEQDSVLAGDLDGDGRAEVVLARTGVSKSGSSTTFTALDGRDGSVRWKWPAAAPKPQPVATGGPTPPPARLPTPPGAPPRAVLPPIPTGDVASLVTVAKDGRKAVVVGSRSPAPAALVLLDGRGHEVARRELPGVLQYELTAVDLTGDGLDELVVFTWGDLRVFGPDLKPLWANPVDSRNQWGNPGLTWMAMPALPDRPGLVIMPSGLVYNGPDGRRLGRGPRQNFGVRKQVTYLESRDPRRPLLWRVEDGQESVCYRMLPDTPERDLVAVGRPPGSPGADPRWQRPLPWVALVDVTEILKLVLLAVVNLAIPLGLLKLAARRRPWTMRVLLVLPLAAAVPLYGLHVFEPLLQQMANGPIMSMRAAYVVATLAGAPLVAFAIATGSSLVRLRWRRLLVLAALLVVCSALVAASWIGYDIRTMPPPGHYDRTGWAFALVPGVELAGSILILGWILRRPIRWLMRPRRAASPS